MRRHLALIGYALGSARRRGGRNVAILLGLVLVTFAFSAVLFLTEALRREFRVAAEALPDIIVQRLGAGRPALIELSDVGFIEEIPGVVSAEPRVWGYYFMPALTGNLTVVGVNTDTEKVQRDLSLVIEKGRIPRGAGSGEAVFGKALAAFFGLEIEDEIKLAVGESGKWLKPVGLFRSESAVWTADVVLTSVADARELLLVPEGFATDVAVRVCTPDESVVVARKIAEHLPDARIIDRQLMRRGYDLTFDTRAGIMAAMLLPALLAFLLLAWDRLSAVGPVERREIGVLKAIGWRTSDVIAARLWESALLGFLGAVIGMVVAYVYVFHARAPGLASVLFGWSTVYPALDLTPAVDLVQILALVCVVVLPFVGASAVPAWRTAISDPHESLRGVV